MPRITRRSRLVLLQAMGQMAVSIAGLLLLCGWFEARMVETLRERTLEVNEHVATQLAVCIEQMNLASPAADPASAGALQRLVERIALPGDGFLCIIDRTDGRLLCHPRLRTEPAMGMMTPGRAVLVGPSSSERIIDAPPTGAGWVTMPDGVHLVGVRDLPAMGIRVLAHQREAGLRASVDSMLDRVLAGGVLAAIVLTMISSVVSMLIASRYESRIAALACSLEDTVERRSRALMRTRDAVIFGLARLAESRDDETGRHLDRIRRYVELPAAQLARDGADLPPEAIATIGLTSSLHDIGKVGIPDQVLRKPGRLDEQERALIQRHTTIGGDCLLSIKQRLGEDDFLTTACEIAFSHHERWDGTGYPFGLAGEQIPLPGRIVALADVYDALTSPRVYKAAMSHEQARRIIVEGRGSHFDPAVVDAFLAIEGEFARLADRLADRLAAVESTPGEDAAADDGTRAAA